MKMQFINLDKLVTSLTSSHSNLVYCTPAKAAKKTLRGAQSKQNFKITRQFRPEYTSTPNYTLPKTSTPVLLRKNSREPSLAMATAKKGMFRNYCVNSTFKEEAHASPKLVAKKLFRDRHTDLVLVRKPKRHVLIKSTTTNNNNNNNNKGSKRALCQKVRKISEHGQSVSFAKKKPNLVLKLASSKKYWSTSGCAKCQRMSADFLMMDERLVAGDAMRGEELLNQLLYRPYPVSYVHRIGNVKPVLACHSDKANKLFQLENVNFNFFSSRA